MVASCAAAFVFPNCVWCCRLLVRMWGALCRSRGDETIIKSIMVHSCCFWRLLLIDLGIDLPCLLRACHLSFSDVLHPLGLPLGYSCACIFSLSCYFHCIYVLFYGAFCWSLRGFPLICCCMGPCLSPTVIFASIRLGVFPEVFELRQPSSLISI